MTKLKNKVICLTPVALALASVFSLPTLAQDAPPSTENEVEVIQVSGIRASVTKALALKRMEVGVSDAISADDIASFPDENIAESIQRIPGIQIQRSNGRGALISIRGMGPEYAATTLNGQSFASAQFNGGFRYDIVQSELASEIQVFKTPSASQEEGGLSGTVNIGTAKPLSFDGRKVLLSAEGIYSGDRESTTPGAGFTYIDQSDDGKLGYLFNAGYQELDTRYDLMFSQRFSDVDADMDGESDYADGIPVEMTDRPRLRREDGNTKRYLFSGAVQYLATDDLELNFTSVVAMDDRDVFFQQLVPLFSGGSPAPELTFLGQTDNTVDHILAENARVEANHTWQSEERTSYALTGNFDWHLSDDLSVTGALHYTAGEFEMYERLRVLGIRSDLEVDMDVNNPQLISQGLNPLDDPNSWDPSNLFRNDLQGRVDVFSTDELAFQLDLEYNIGGDFLQTFKTGVKQRIQTLETSSRRYNANYRTEEEILNAPFDTVAESYIVVDDFTGGEFPGLSLDYVLPNIVEAVASYGEPKDTMPEDLLAASFFEIDRDITTVYGQLDFATGGLRGNVGLRYAYTDRTVNTLDYDNGITISDGALELVGGEGTPVTLGHDYSNWLPSLNLAYDLTDTVVLRAAIGKALVRPIIGSPENYARAISATSDGTNTIVAVSEGHADLPALTANQFDLSAEWYFNESGALSVAYFRKNIKNQVRTETVCPENFDLANVSFDSASNECMGDDGYIYNITRNRVTDGELKMNGLEFAYNQSFDFLPAPFNGLGVIANYTILDAENPDELQPLLGSSEKTYNLVTYYENDGFSVRIALNNRSEYAVNDGFKYGRNYGPSSSLYPNPGATLEARNQIDISVGYEINEDLKVSFEGLNINGDYELGTRFEEARLQSVATFGSTYFVKLRYSL
ncbi:TonB-dependent receptor [uncultured Paraglaciecola sp.]|uniref:TonB-dependent receptor n=1 Tax=uncultured Paraglaciecola sp. TaxID=1765024 RepID=UPI0030D9A5B8|tara:strand:- start:229749 stop:232490 length:2742 start_codon:yes stop_codon:yes gene_type:complete